MAFSQTPIQPVEATGPGALSGFEARCSCGLVIRSSLESIARRDAWEHSQWHARGAQAGRSARGR